MDGDFLTYNTKELMEARSLLLFHKYEFVCVCVARGKVVPEN